jgi:hypothetical protein
VLRRRNAMASSVIRAAGRLSDALARAFGDRA